MPRGAKTFTIVNKDVLDKVKHHMNEGLVSVHRYAYSKRETTTNDSKADVEPIEREHCVVINRQ